MLQQTTVAAVAPRFERFVARWPSIEALASAPDDDVLSEWAGLGYYARARNLIACAREVVGRGGFPTLRNRAPVVAGIGRLHGCGNRCDRLRRSGCRWSTRMSAASSSRLHALAEPSAAEVTRIVAALTPADRPGDFAQAMMDLGATICRPEGAAVRNLSACARLRCPRARRSRGLPGRKDQSRFGRFAMAAPGGSSARRGLAGPTSGKGPARRHGGALPGSEWSDAPSRRSRRARHHPPRLHPFRARPAYRTPHFVRRRRLVAADRQRSTRPACRRSIAEPPLGVAPGSPEASAAA